MQIRRDYRLVEPVGEDSRPAERCSSLRSLDSLLWSRKVKRNSPLPAETFGAGSNPVELPWTQHSQRGNICVKSMDK